MASVFKFGDIIFKKYSLSDKVVTAKILTPDFENEYLIKLKFENGEEKFIHKSKIAKYWKLAKNGTQGQLFTYDLTEKYKRKFRNSSKHIKR